jgi:hypothetical protein
MKEVIITITILLIGIITNVKSQDKITAAANAVELRELWRYEGRWHEGVGAGVGGGFDLNGDGIMDFCIKRQPDGNIPALDTFDWRFYLGGQSISQEPIYKHNNPTNGNILKPIVGHITNRNKTWIQFIW